MIRDDPPLIPVEPTVRDIAQAYVCRCYDVTASELKAKGAYRHLTYARALFVWIIRTYRPSVAYPTIGRWIGRDHSSAHHLFKRAKGLLETDEDFRQECARFPQFMARHRGPD